MKTEQILSVEQTKHLQELGLDMSDASIYWARVSHGSRIYDKSKGKWFMSISELNTDKPKEERFKNCLQMFIDQGHSGMSASLVFSGLCRFHDLGPQLVDYIKKH